MLEKYKNMSIFALKKKIQGLKLYQARDQKIQIGMHQSAEPLVKNDFIAKLEKLEKMDQ